MKAWRARLRKVTTGSCRPEPIHIVDNFCVRPVVHFGFGALRIPHLTKLPFGRIEVACRHILA